MLRHLAHELEVNLGERHCGARHRLLARGVEGGGGGGAAAAAAEFSPDDELAKLLSMFGDLAPAAAAAAAAADRASAAAAAAASFSDFSDAGDGRSPGLDFGTPAEWAAEAERDVFAAAAAAAAAVAGDDDDGDGDARGGGDDRGGGARPATPFALRVAGPARPDAVELEWEDNEWNPAGTSWDVEWREAAAGGEPRAWASARVRATRCRKRHLRPRTV